MLSLVRRARGVGIGLIVAVLAGATAATATADLVADYRFDGDFESSVGSPSSASPSGAATTFGTESIAGCSRQALSFPEGGGVFMGTKELVGSGPYTLIVQARFDAVSPWVRVVNWFPSFAVDGGLYLHEGKLAFYDTMGGGVGGSTAVAPGQFAELAVTRDAAKMVRGYVNGVPSSPISTLPTSPSAPIPTAMSTSSSTTPPAEPPARTPRARSRVSVTTTRSCPPSRSPTRRAALTAAAPETP